MYHERMGTTEKYLTAIQLVDKLTPEKKDESLLYLIRVILSDNSSILRSGNTNIEKEITNESYSSK